MQIRFPRRLQLGFRPWYGLTLRQLIYVVIAGVLGGAAILLIQTEFLVRVLIGLVFILIGITLAFFRKDGLTVEQWLVAWLKYTTRPRRRVWSRGDGGARHRQVADIDSLNSSDGGGTPSPPPVSEDSGPVSNVRLLHPTPPAPVWPSGVVVFIDLILVISLFLLVIYLWAEGWFEVREWLAPLWER